uniref:BRO1 domain-containing protein n=1 Tax=Dendroctonus ponderosae TaxID=77166 RepID=J3JZI5_DENPD|nr:unknown [Dendroctonus ponderosae]
MSHWFHRNPLKSTAFTKFELKKVINKESASKICGEIRLRRSNFLDKLRSAANEPQEIESEFQQYLALFYGFVFDIPENGNTSDNISNSKLRYFERFVWSNSMLNINETIDVADSWFEVLSICVNVALWYMKRGAWISSKDEVRETEAKQIHSALRKAAGIFIFVKENIEKLNGMYEFAGSDMDSKVLDAYITQCIAEAQEITIARAIELKHKPSLISALATETANKYQCCDKLIENFNPLNFEKWRKYFQLKHRFYSAYAYAYLGESLLSEDKCGAAIRACKEGIQCYNMAEELCSKYAKSSGPGFVAKPEQHLFFRRIVPLLDRHLKKAEQENDFIYHQMVPEERPLLEEKASFGLAQPEPFVYPNKFEGWTIAAYKAFDISKTNIVVDFGKPKKGTKSLPPVKEEKVYETDKDPTNHSGCSIS